MVRLTAHARGGLAVSALILAVVALTLTRPTLGFSSAVTHGPDIVVAAAGTEAHIFELQVAGPECSVQKVDGVPDEPPTAGSIRSIYVYADDLYETYAALCRAGS